MLEYNPDTPPSATAWLEADEGVRIMAVEAWHNRERIELPNAKLHAVAHTIVENQIAGNLEPVVRAMTRLEMEGLSRHDALHAVGWVLALHLHDMFAKSSNEDSEAANVRYLAAVERLTAKAWHAQEGV
jgi:alpha-beta hydrolase superfamily lysophospholipase